jgi:hypothetical protein
MIRIDMGRHEVVSQAPAEQEQKVHQGEMYLKLLNLGHLADQDIPGYGGKQARDFLEVCGDHALPALVKFADSKPEDPMYTDPAHEDYIGLSYNEMHVALQDTVLRYVTPQPQEG